MTAIILIGLSFALILAGFLYLSHQDFAGDTFTEKIQNAVKKNVKLILYLCIAFMCMVGLSIIFLQLYKNNTLIDNIKLITLLALLVTAAVQDLKEHISPNKVILAGIILRICYAIAELIMLRSGYFAILKEDMFSFLLVLVLFLLGVVMIKNGIGMGDIKLIFVMGIFQGISGLISSLFFSLMVSFFVAVAALVMKKKGRKDAIPFAPSVLLGTAVSMFLTGM